ncbi:hypothetical protein MMC10_008430 [Thelotrema lepadinum]|nr:hypothetical protein [Thelotrema lepadinum]
MKLSTFTALLASSALSNACAGSRPCSDGGNRQNNNEWMSAADRKQLQTKGYIDTIPVPMRRGLDPEYDLLNARAAAAGVGGPAGKPGPGNVGGPQKVIPDKAKPDPKYWAIPTGKPPDKAVNSGELHNPNTDWIPSQLPMVRRTDDAWVSALHARAAVADAHEAVVRARDAVQQARAIFE